MIYRRRVSPLHAVRAGVAVSYCLALALAALLASNPLELAAVTAAILGAGVAARVGSALRTALIVAIPMGIAIALVNALLTRDGLTVIARLGDLPLLGHTDVHEALPGRPNLIARVGAATAVRLTSIIEPARTVRCANARDINWKTATFRAGSIACSVVGSIANRRSSQRRRIRCAGNL